MIMHDRHLDGRVAPFGNPRVKGYLHLAVDYRGLSRPSSSESLGIHRAPLIVHVR